jgi:putative transposase
MPITTQCQLLGLSRSSVYYSPWGVSEADLRLMRRLDELHLEHPFLGSRKLARLLNDEGHAVGRRHVTTLMHSMGIEAIYRKPRTSLPNQAHKIYPYLLSQVVIERANQAWAADITYLPMAKGFVYLVAILDLYSRKVLAWRTNNTLTSDFCVEALQEALTRFARPEISTPTRAASSPLRSSPTCSRPTTSLSAWTARVAGSTMCSSSGSGAASSMRRSTCMPMRRPKKSTQH